MKSEKIALTLLLLFSAAANSCMAQEMGIEGFNRLKNRQVKKAKIQKDKGSAVLLLTTEEHGFQFKADAKTDLQAKEGDGQLTLTLPHKTRWLLAVHPDYGQYSWRAPGKGFRKSRVYHAFLRTFNPDKEKKQEKQWVEFQVEPRNAIIHIDSTTTLVRDGQARYHLPTGKHPYTVEAPFYETVEDTLELSDDHPLLLPVRLRCVYSYLSVKTPAETSRIYVDREYIGRHEAVSGHLKEGSHRLSVFVGSRCCYDATVTIGKGEKKVVEIKELR